MSLDKTKLKAQMKAKSPTLTPKKVDIQLTDLTKSNVVKPYAVRPTKLKGVKKLSRASDGVTNTKRYAFELTPALMQELTDAIEAHRQKTGKKLSNSAVVRTALAKYLKAGKL